jgi:hypothetical protein
VLGAHREGEVWVVRLGRAATRTLVHHEIPAVGLDSRLESIDRLYHLEQLLRTLRSGQANPERREAICEVT